MQWGNEKRIRMLKDTILPKSGVYWKGDTVSFVEFLIKAIQQMPDDVRDAMERHYITGGTREKDEFGRPRKRDSMYYHLTMQGRKALVTVLRFAQHDPETVEELGARYGTL